MVKAKCVPILIYGLEAFNLTESAIKSLDFSVSCFFMKLFKTINAGIISECERFFHLTLPSVLLTERCRG